MADIHPSLYEILHGRKDPQAPHLADCLVHLDLTGSPEWLLVLQGMTGQIRELLRAQHRRASTGKSLKRIAKALEVLDSEMDKDDVRDALSVLAPPRKAPPSPPEAPPLPREIDDIFGFEYHRQLSTRVERTRAAIRPGKGRDLLQDSLGIPTPRLLCAACIVAVLEADGRKPHKTNEDAQAACRELWRAAGGPDSNSRGLKGLATSPEGGIHGALWERHLKDALTSSTPAATLALKTARWHVAAIRHQGQK